MKTEKIKFLPVACLLSLLVFTGCKDDKEDPPKPKSRTELLTAHQWVRQGWNISPAIDFDGDGTQENDLWPYVQTCNRDDFYFFTTSLVYTLEEGTTKCDENDPQVIETGTWTWNSDETILTVSPNGFPTAEVPVQELTESKMVWKEVVVIEGVTYTVITELVKR